MSKECGRTSLRRGGYHIPSKISGWPPVRRCERRASATPSASASEGGEFHVDALWSTAPHYATQHPRSSFPFWINLFASVWASHMFLDVVDLQTLPLSEVVRASYVRRQSSRSLAHSSTTQILPPVRLPTSISATVLRRWVCILGRYLSQHTRNERQLCPQAVGCRSPTRPTRHPQPHLEARQSVRILFDWYVGISGLHIRVSESGRWCHRRLNCFLSRRYYHLLRIPSPRVYAHSLGASVQTRWCQECAPHLRRPTETFDAVRVRRPQEVLDLMSTVYNRNYESLCRLGGGVGTQSSVNNISLWSTTLCSDSDF